MKNHDSLFQKGQREAKQIKWRKTEAIIFQSIDIYASKWSKIGHSADVRHLVEWKKESEGLRMAFQT